MGQEGRTATRDSGAAGQVNAGYSATYSMTAIFLPMLASGVTNL